MVKELLKIGAAVPAGIGAFYGGREIGRILGLDKQQVMMLPPGEYDEDAARIWNVPRHVDATYIPGDEALGYGLEFLVLTGLAIWLVAGMRKNQ
jgi:hypothetical protein